MISLSSFLSLMHLVGLALGVGAASVKLLLLLKCKEDFEYVSAFLKVTKLITRLIVLGVILLTLSGLGWLFLVGGYPYTPRLILKLVLVSLVWFLGPHIDNVVEPKFQRLAPAPSEHPSPEFLKAQSRYLALEVLATGAFYFIIALWVIF